MAFTATSHSLETETMDWVPIVFITFKALVFGTGMFFAIKWHYDQGKLGRVAERRAVMRMAGLVIVIFVPLAAGLLFATFYVCEKLGLT
jgi:hypothetical protein